MKIGILGGTFNPVHLGHLILAQECQQKLKLDKVVFIPAKIPPHKTRRMIIDAQDRYQMLKLALRGNPDFEVSRIELDRQGTKSYSVDTLSLLKKKWGDEVNLFFITGADALAELHSWKDMDKIFKIARFIIATRPGYCLKNAPAKVKAVAIKAIDISATDIRRRIAGGKSIRYLVPDVVRRHIEKKKLYRK
ncbi:MAG: nicotinate-nucleotide adenylyltransferase [Candidatus Omnitrophica bacterium]|nr:nicotinate-nucleotide adenylyltransferase [Candidatus Omnitrophota bacterium]